MTNYETWQLETFGNVLGVVDGVYSEFIKPRRLEATHFIELYNALGVIEETGVNNIELIGEYTDYTNSCSFETVAIWKIKYKN
jgi:hypothetical protein